MKKVFNNQYALSEAEYPYNDRTLLSTENNRLSYTYSIPKKSGKKKKKSQDTDSDYVSQDDFIQYYMDVDRIKRLQLKESYFPPREVTFDSLKNSGFVFGLHPNTQLVGKKQDQDGHIIIFGGSGTGKTTCIAIPSYHKWQGSIFALDFKGDLVEYAEKKHGIILYLCENEQNWFYVDPFSLLKLGGDNNTISNARALAYAIIPLPPNIKD